MAVRKETGWVNWRAGDRWAASLVPQYDPVTSTEMLYKDTPLSALRYSKEKPRVKDGVLVIAGPDKGRSGVLLGVEKGQAIIKLSTKELKVLDIEKIAKELKESKK